MYSYYVIVADIDCIFQGCELLDRSFQVILMCFRSISPVILYDLEIFVSKFFFVIRFSCNNITTKTRNFLK